MINMPFITLDYQWSMAANLGPGHFRRALEKNMSTASGVTVDANIELFQPALADALKDMVVVLSQRMAKDEHARLSFFHVSCELFEALI